MSVHSQTDLILARLASIKVNQAREVNAIELKIKELESVKKNYEKELKELIDQITIDDLNALVTDGLIIEWRELVAYCIDMNQPDWKRCKKNSIVDVCQLLQIDIDSFAFKTEDNVLNICGVRDSLVYANPLLYQFLTKLNERANTTGVVIY